MSTVYKNDVVHCNKITHLSYLDTNKKKKISRIHCYRKRFTTSEIRWWPLPPDYIKVKRDLLKHDGSKFILVFLKILSIML